MAPYECCEHCKHPKGASQKLCWILCVKGPAQVCSVAVEKVSDSVELPTANSPTDDVKYARNAKPYDSQCAVNAMRLPTNSHQEFFYDKQ